MIDAVARDTLSSKTLKVTQKLFEEMAMNSYRWHTSQVKPNKSTHVYDVDAVIALATQVEALSKKINGLSVIK